MTTQSTIRRPQAARRALPWALGLALLGLMATPATANDAPNWTLTDATGQEYSFHQEHPKGPSIVLFWATWCPYCKALMPHLQSMLEEYRGEQALRVYAISFREDGDPLKYLERQGFSFIAFPEGGDDVASAYDVSGTPGLFVVDAGGRIVLNLYKVTAAMSTDPEWESLNNRQKAARRAPYWGARIREALDRLYTAP
ncbi:MAG: TlpA disulfide reductase family protein [Pseudomonadota bacterium]